MEDEKDQIELVENLLRVYKVMPENETIYDFLARPYAEIYSALNMFFSARENEFKPIPNVQNDLLWLGYIPILVNFSGAFFVIDQFSDNEEIGYKATKLREITDRTIIRSLSSYLVMFLKWDLNRRVWKSDNEELKISFLIDQLSDLDGELQGKKPLVKKYVGLLFDFIVANIDELISSVNFEDPRFDKAKLLATRKQFLNIVKSNKIDDVVDDDLEESFAKMYKPLAQDFVEGLTQTSNRYDFLFSPLLRRKMNIENSLKGF